MKDHPILFNTEMVRAVLDGRKSQTRRVVSEWQQPYKVNKKDADLIGKWGVVAQRDPRYGFCFFGDTPEECMQQLAPNLSSYEIGGLLWVREKWCVHKNYDGIKPSLLPEKKYLQQGITYFADIYNGEKSSWMGKTRPSIFMPKKYARIWLKIKDIRVERVQDITDDDAIAEGIKKDIRKYVKCIDYIGEFQMLWDSINANRKDKQGQVLPYSWNDNPYVWCVEFERIEK